jgi:hypothetical protein
MNAKTINIIGWTLTGLVGFVLISTAIIKFMVPAEKVAELAKMGLTLTSMKYIGALELFCAILFIIPRTGILGTLLVAAYMGGAIATSLEHDQSILVPCLVEAVAWITAVIRFPELLPRIQGK